MACKCHPKIRQVVSGPGALRLDPSSSTPETSRRWMSMSLEQNEIGFLRHVFFFSGDQSIFTMKHGMKHTVA